MGLLNLVEQHHTIGLSAHRFGQLSALIVANIPRRSTNQARHTELFLILTHVDTRHHVLVVEEVFGQCFCQFRLSHARCSKENERRYRSFRVLKSGPTAANGIANGIYGLVLSDDTLMEFLLQMEQFVALALQHSTHRNAGPAANDLGDVVCSDLFSDQGLAFLLADFIAMALYFVVDLLHFTVANLGHTLVIALAFGLFGLAFQVFLLFFQLRNLVHFALLCLPTCPERLHFILELGDFLLQESNLLRVVFTQNSLSFDFFLLQRSLQFIKLFGYGIAFHAQLCSRFIHQINGLVRQETVGNVTLGELYGRYTSIILYPYLMVVLIPFLQSSQDTDGI